MRESISIGCVPFDEECEQVGSDNYDPIIARKQAETFANQLIRQFGEPPINTRIRVKAQNHDFGLYWDVEVVYDTDFTESLNYAFACEAQSPSNWDNQSLEELKL